jgi:C4-dicarboxylate-specific signal transduction histidine kinase
MTDILDVDCESALQFFGAVTASISHEINNVLAVINEKAGLLEDFIYMADKGMPTDPEKLKSLAEKITAQIQRADQIIKNMNTFAHSVDLPIKRVNLKDLIKLMLSLSTRSASMRGVRLEQRTSEVTLFITTNDFFLENLLWLYLDFAMAAAGPDKAVALNAEEIDNHIVIQFSGLGGIKDVPCNGSPGFRDEGLLGALKAKMTIDTEAGKLSLFLPKNINQ